MEPDYAEAHFRLGGVYVELGRYKDAVEPFKQAIRIEPDNADAWFYAGYCYVELGRYKDAVESSKQAIRIKPDYAVLIALLLSIYILILILFETLNSGGDSMNEERAKSKSTLLEAITRKCGIMI